MTRGDRSRRRPPSRRAVLRLGLRWTAGSALGAALGSALIDRALAQPDTGQKSGQRPGQKSGPRSGQEARATSCILLYMTGGPSQLDTFDPKPALPGAARAIATPVAGMQIAEHLPRLARFGHDLAIVRSIASKEGNHVRAQHLMHTGYAPVGGVAHPALGAIAASELSAGALPGYVSINSPGSGPGAGPGFLGAAHAPFAVRDATRPVRNLIPVGAGKQVAEDARARNRARFAERVSLWRQLEDDFAATHDSDVTRDRRAIGERAIAMIQSAESVAFDLDAEPRSVRQAYGDDAFALGCLMARRLVEAGVPFVEVNLRGWDTHFDHHARIRAQCAVLDRGMSALLADLSARGLLASTLVAWTGDFGRTPWISERGGRDHHPATTPAVLAGGGVRGGQVVGDTGPDGRAVVSGAVAVADLFATIAAAIGLDPAKTRTSRAGRPLRTTDGGAPIPGLLS